MSSTLRWRPTNHEGEYLGDQLKFILRKRYGGIVSEWVELGRSDIQYLEGVAVGAQSMPNRSGLEQEVRAVIALINKHGAIEVRETF